MNTRIEALDLLRFAAAFAVLMYHYFFIGPLGGHWPESQYFNFAHVGDFGVDVFFIISGFVIVLSTQGRSYSNFAKARIIRILPAFFVCSIFTMLTSILLPGVDKAEVFYKWLASLTFFPKLFGQEYLASVYWTIAIEVKFYILVTLLMAVGLWKRLDIILPIWVSLAVVNEFVLHNSLLHDIFLTQYAGHFTAGILLYQLHTKSRTPFLPLGFLVSTILIWNSVNSFENWIGQLYNVRFTDIATFLIAPTAILLVNYVINIPKVPMPGELISKLGAISYTLYLIHADFGFFLRMIWYSYGVENFPRLVPYISDQLIVMIAIISSIGIALIVSSYLEPPLKKITKKLLNLKINNLNSSLKQKHL